MSVNENLLEAIGALYRAAASSALWPEASRAIANLLAAERCSLVVPGEHGGFANVLAPDTPADLTRLYLQHIYKVDPYRLDEQGDRAVNARTPGPHTKLGQAIISERDLVRTEYYNDYARHLGAYHMLGAAMDEANPIPLAVFRPRSRTAFDRESEGLLRLLVPHLKQALILRRTLMEANRSTQAGLGALDASPVASIVVAADLALQFRNVAAEDLIAGSSQVRFAQDVKRFDPCWVVRLSHPEDQVSLEKLVDQVASKGGAGGIVRFRGGDRTRDLSGVIGLRVLPLPGRMADDDRGTVPGLALLIVDRLVVRPAAASHLLAAYFNLSKAEAAVAEAMLGGKSLENVARLRGVSLETVRTQIKAVLRKSGAASLREFERLAALLHG